MSFADFIINTLIGIVQGLTEFIPVSSSGHLEIVPALFGWEQPDTILILFAHFGTLLSLLIYFRKDIWQYIKSVLVFATNADQRSQAAARTDLRVVGLVLLGTIPAGVLGLLLSDFIEVFYDTETYGNAGQVATLSAMAFLGVVFLFSEDWFQKNRVALEKMGFLSALIIGASQALAFVRGVSRSGITLLVGQAFKLNRVDAARYSFLVSIPLIIAASALGVYDLIQLPAEEITAQLYPALVVLVSSFISGLFAISYLLEYLKKNTLAIFGWYRIIFAIISAILIFG